MSFVNKSKTVSLTSPPFFVFNTLIYHYRSFPTVLLSCIYLQPIKRSEFEAAHCRKVGTVGGTLLLVKINLRYRLFPTVLVSCVYSQHIKRSELRAEVLGLVAVFVGDEDYFYSVLVTLMSHYDIIVANPVGA